MTHYSFHSEIVCFLFGGRFEGWRADMETSGIGLCDMKFTESIKENNSKNVYF